MTKRPIASWIWKILRITVILIFISGLVDVTVVIAHRVAYMFRPQTPIKEVLNSPISEYAIKAPAAIPTPKGPFDDLLKNPDLGSKPIVKETVYLYVSPQEIFATYEIYLPKDHPLLSSVQQSVQANQADTMVNKILGPITLSWTPLQFPVVNTLITSDETTARLYITSKAIVPDRSSYSVLIRYPYEFNLQIQQREVVIKTTQAQVWSAGEVPFSKSEESTAFHRAVSPNEFYLAIEFPAGAISSPEPERKPTPSLAQVLSKSLDPPVLNAILYGVLAGLPFLLFLYWAKKYDFAGEQPGFQNKVEVVQLYLVLHFGLYFFLAVNDAVTEWGNPAISAFRWWQQNTIQLFELYERQHEYFLPRMLMFLCAWPLIVHRWERQHGSTSTRWKDRGAQTLLALIFASLVFSAMFSIYRIPNFSIANANVINAYTLMISVLLFALIAALLGLAFEIFDRRRAGATLIMFVSLAILLIAEIFPTVSDVRRGNFVITGKIIGGLVVLITALVLIFTFARLIYRLVAGEPLSRAWAGWAFRKRAVVLMVIAAAALSTRTWPPENVHVMSLGYILRNLLLLGVIWSLVSFLRDKASDALWLHLPESTRRAGILLAMVSFYSPTTRWNYIPVTFLVGFLMLDKWLLPSRRFDKSLFVEIRGKLPDLIRKVIRFNDEEKTLTSLNKELLSKVAKGDMSHEDYDQKFQAQSNVVETLKADLTIQGRFAKEVILAFGPTDSAWQNGKKAAQYGIWFALPWTILFLRDIVRGSAYQDGYLILDVVAWILAFMLPWVSYGFVFGYFYPYIKGKNGVKKAVSLFLTIVLPQLVWTVLARTLDSEYWFSFGFWVLQVFVHTMLLGLVAGDYETFRKAGYRWKHLLEIHRLGALSAWASSIVIAIGAAVGALITSGATQVFVSVLKFAADNVSATGK